MKVLFVCSGNSIYRISPIIKNQGLSLQNEGVNITYFSIIGKGLIGYLKNIKVLKDFIKKNNFDYIHAHYSMSAFVASLAGSNPLIVSLMGSDVKSDKIFKIFIYLFNRFAWSKIIVKSEDMKMSLGIKETQVIPNGVDLDKFKPLDQLECKKKLKWNCNKKQILFASNPNRDEKNYPLAKNAFTLLDDVNYELKVLEDIPNNQMPLHLNAADLVLLTSFWEGSPNVIKEAMACNRPILSTNVGDVSTLLSNVKGCNILDANSQDIADKIKFSLENFSFSDGREKVKLLKIDSRNIAIKIIKLYEIIKYGK
jgi:teichuronic acid biosynthesis glycosyltransferase TuaC